MFLGRCRNPQRWRRNKTKLAHDKCNNRQVVCCVTTEKTEFASQARLHWHRIQRVIAAARHRQRLIRLSQTGQPVTKRRQQRTSIMLSEMRSAEPERSGQTAKH